MDDRELLDLALKAAGKNGMHHPEGGIVLNGGFTRWNPLTDDGDALRLAVKLRLVVHVWDDESTVSVAKTLPDGSDPEDTSAAWHSADSHAFGGTDAATRRAIVSVAAEIGRAM